MAMSNPVIEAALKASIQRVVTALAARQADDAAKLEGKTLAEITSEILAQAATYTDGEVIDLVEGNALVAAIDEAINEAGLPVGGEMNVAIIEKLADLAAGTAIDVRLANHYKKTITGATTLSVSNVPESGRVVSFTLHLVNGGSAAVNYWPNISWSEGTKPTLKAAGRDVLAFTSYDGGATWDGYHIGRDMKLPA
ncbi:hypothetical protein PA10_00005 [Pseudomonas phage pPa_SNUABM_DT01]|nr:hypothetical protein PA10_00005 [Pseudomonas phage pPa_SNUABM_DT01]